MAIVKEVTVARNYTVNGEEKTQWTNIGRIIEKNGKQYLKLDVIPLNWDGFASLFDPKPREAKEPAKANGYQPGQDEPDSEIPF